MALFSDSSALYFYSAAFQANAALLPVIAFLGVSKLQSIGGKIEGIRTVLLADKGRIIHQHKVLEVDSWSTEKKRAWAETLTGDLKVFANSWIGFEEESTKTKEFLKLPTVLLGGIMGWSALGVATASWMHQASPCWEGVLIFATLAFNIWILGLVVKRVLKLCSE